MPYIFTRTCYWYSHSQHMAMIAHEHRDPDMLRLPNGHQKAYTAITIIPLDEPCEKPEEADRYHDYRLVPQMSNIRRNSGTRKRRLTAVAELTQQADGLWRCAQHDES